jgi:hypothetical protein
MSIPPSQKYHCHGYHAISLAMVTMMGYSWHPIPVREDDVFQYGTCAARAKRSSGVAVGSQLRRRRPSRFITYSLVWLYIYAAVCSGIHVQLAKRYHKEKLDC